MATSWTLLPVEGAPKELQGVKSVEHGLVGTAEHLKKQAQTGHKERVDLAALKQHTGTSYAQVEAIPDAVFERLRQQLAGVAPIVLLPPTGSLGTKANGVVLFVDAHAPIKGLPVNKRATMLLNACGLKGRGEMRGDAFLAHLQLAEGATDGSGVALGAAFEPPKIAQREWLEAAQAANVGGATSEAGATLEKALSGMLEATKRAQIARAVASTSAPGSAPAPAAAAATTGGGTASAAASAATKDAVTDVSDPAAAADGAPAAAAGLSGELLSWADEDDTVSVFVRVPAGTKAKHCLVRITDTHLRAEVHTLPAAQRVVVDGELFQEVNGKDCTWGLEDDAKAKDGARKLTVTLEKKKAVTNKQMRWIMLTRQ